MRPRLTFANIRLDSEVLTFRNHEQEMQGPVLKGVVVLCLQSKLRIEDIHLQLFGILRHL